MALYHTFNLTDLSSFPLIKHPKLISKPSSVFSKVSPFAVRSVATSGDSNGEGTSAESVEKAKKKLSEQSSWEAKDAEGNDYLYRLGKESENMNIAVGARAGVIDDLFVGDFLGKDCMSFLCFCFISFRYLFC